MKHLILASGSPRRKQLLQLANLPFTISVSNIKENMNNSLETGQIVEQLAYQKANDVFQATGKESVVLGADTVVSFEEHVLGKPKDNQEAEEMLRMLSGQTHQVYTGVSIISEQKTVKFHEKTDVTFFELTDDELAFYLKTGESHDKAGAYGIQGAGAILVRKIAGDYYNVVGLPIARTIRELKVFGFTPNIVSHED